MRFWDLFSKMNGKRLIVFGAGARGSTLLRQYSLPIAYFVDNDFAKWGQCIDEVLIQSPDVLKDEPVDSLAIIISSVDNVDEISTQLRQMGFVKDKDFWVNPDESTPNAIGEINNYQTELLVTCIGFNGGLFRLSLPEDRTTKLIDGCFRGICKVGKYYFVVDEPWGIRQYDEEFREVDSVEGQGVGLRKLHGIAYHKSSNCLYVVETHLASIGMYQMNPLRRIGEWKFRDSTADENAINDLCIEGDDLYLSMHSYTGFWRRGIWDGVTIRANLKDKHNSTEILLRGHEQPHSLSSIDKSFYYCNSYRCELCCNNEVIATFPGYTRGLAYDGKYFYVGQSEMKHLHRVTKSNTCVDCGVHIYDPVEKISRFVKMPAVYIYGIHLFEQ